MVNDNYSLENAVILNKYHECLEKTGSLEGDGF